MGHPAAGPLAATPRNAIAGGSATRELEIYEGKLLLTDEERLNLLGLLLENLGAERAVRLGNPWTWVVAIRNLNPGASLRPPFFKDPFNRWMLAIWILSLVVPISFVVVAPHLARLTPEQAIIVVAAAVAAVVSVAVNLFLKT